MIAGLVPNIVHLLMLPVYTRFLDPSDYGIVSLIMAFCTFLLVFAGRQLANSLGGMLFIYSDKFVLGYFSPSPVSASTISPAEVLRL